MNKTLSILLLVVGTIWFTIAFNSWKFSSSSEVEKKDLLEDPYSLESFNAKFQEKKPQWKIDMENEDRMKREKFASQQDSFQFGREELASIIRFIDTRGFSIYEGSAKQFTFHDSKGSRHACIHSTGRNEVIVHGYKNGIKTKDTNLENFFPYDIKKDGVFGLNAKEPMPDDEFPFAVRGYRELLALAQK